MSNRSTLATRSFDPEDSVSTWTISSHHSRAEEAVYVRIRVSDRGSFSVALKMLSRCVLDLLVKTREVEGTPRSLPKAVDLNG